MVYLGFISLLTVLAAAAPATHELSRRDVCDSVGHSPLLYHSYKAKDCPPKYELNSDGICDHLELSNQCTAFCQIRTEFKYGREEPWDLICDSSAECTYTIMKTTTVTRSWSVTPALMTVFNIGITGGYSTANATSTSASFKATLEDGQCGYFTWVPIEKETCGTLTRRGDQYTCIGDTHTTGNVCATQLQRNRDGTSAGVTVFVLFDCATHAPLPMDKQKSPIYKMPGVSDQRAGQYAYAKSLGRQAGTASGSNAGPYVHLQDGSDCTSKTLVTCYDWPEDKCCKSGISQKNAVYFGGNTDTLVNYQNWISDNPSGAPEEYCTTIKGSSQADGKGDGVCVSGKAGTGGASWSKIVGCPSLEACSGPGRRSLEANGTQSAAVQQPSKCKDHAFGDHLAYPEEGGVLVIPGEWVEKWHHILAALPATNEARVEQFDKMGALYYRTVAEYSEYLNEDGTSKN